jgi:hypothetical protein
MPSKMLPPSIPGGQPGAQMPSPAPRKPKKKAPGSQKPVGRFGQVGPRTQGGFGVQAPAGMTV